MKKNEIPDLRDDTCSVQSECSAGAQIIPPWLWGPLAPPTSSIVSWLEDGFKEYKNFIDQQFMIEEIISDLSSSTDGSFYNGGFWPPAEFSADNYQQELMDATAQWKLLLLS